MCPTESFHQNQSLQGKLRHQSLHVLHLLAVVALYVLLPLTLHKSLAEKPPKSISLPAMSRYVRAENDQPGAHSFAGPCSSLVISIYKAPN